MNISSFGSRAKALWRLVVLCFCVPFLVVAMVQEQRVDDDYLPPHLLPQRRSWLKSLWSTLRDLLNNKVSTLDEIGLSWREPALLEPTPTDSPVAA